MEIFAPFIDKYNIVAGGIVGVLSYMFGEHWTLFAAYLLLNVGDWLTGWLKSRINGRTSSVLGFKGVLKKVGHWLLIALAFGVSVIFVEIGNVIGVDLGVTTILGWFVLANLTINEIRSIIENFVEAGIPVPGVLTKGLAVAVELLEQKEGTDDNHSQN